MAINEKANAYPIRTPREGHNLLSPSLAFSESVPKISAAIAIDSRIHAMGTF
jgi:hypothetical protein